MSNQFQEIATEILTRIKGDISRADLSSKPIQGIKGVLGPCQYASALSMPLTESHKVANLAAGVSVIGQHQLVTGVFFTDSQGVRFLAIHGQIRREGLLPQKLEQFESIKSSIAKWVSTEFSIFSKNVMSEFTWENGAPEEGYVRFVISLDGKTPGGQPKLFTHEEFLSTINPTRNNDFKCFPGKICSSDPDCIKLGDFGRHQESCVVVLVKETPENIAHILNWCKMTTQTRVGVEYGNRFMNIEL